MVLKEGENSAGQMMTRESCAANEHGVSMEIKLWEPGVFRSQSQCWVNSSLGSEQTTLLCISNLPSVTRDITTDIVQRATLWTIMSLKHFKSQCSAVSISPQCTAATPFSTSGWKGQHTKFCSHHISELPKVAAPGPELWIEKQECNLWGNSQILPDILIVLVLQPCKPTV